MSKSLLVINPPVLAVDAYQVGLYAEAIPFGLLQVATRHALEGDDVTFLDMMEYRDGDFAKVLEPDRLWDRKPVGDARSTLQRDVYRYGRSLDWLRERLAAMAPPDEVLVTCCISFNHEPARAVIAACRERFPRATIRLGGFYATAFGEHARSAGADEVFAGRDAAADAVFPRLDLLQRVPAVWLFRLVLGCRYRCSYCSNSLYRTEVASDPVAVADEVCRIAATWPVTTFSNWDPNVMLRTDVLEPFLDLMSARHVPVGLKFEMGIQPDLLTEPIARKMQRAGVSAMTIPFESAEPEMSRRFGKPYGMQASMDALAMCRDLGFDTRRFHCTWVVGLRDESWRHVFRTYFGILKAGGWPTPFPLSPTPGTREYQRHEQYLAGKDLAALNGHLWPALPAERVPVYDRAFEAINEADPRRAASIARHLSPEAAAAFDQAYEWYLEGPHRPGTPVGP
jgi:hypothetical protein